MSDLQRLSTRYVEREDRIRLTGENKGRGVITLWLTQRLANLTIGPLCQWNESQAQDSQVASKPRLRMQHEHTFAQERTTQAMNAPQPVPSEGMDTESLVESVDVQRGSNSVRLVFKDGQLNHPGDADLQSYTAPSMDVYCVGSIQSGAVASGCLAVMDAERRTETGGRRNKMALIP